MQTNPNRKNNIIYLKLSQFCTVMPKHRPGPKNCQQWLKRGRTWCSKPCHNDIGRCAYNTVRHRHHKIRRDWI